MALATINPTGDADAVTKINAAINKANEVDAKATTSALAAESANRAALARQVSGLATKGEVAAESASRITAITALDAAVQDRASFGEASGDPARVGEPGRFATSDLYGSADATAPIGEQLKVRSPTMGAVIAMVSGYVAPRKLFRIEPGRRYRARFAFQRAIDTVDPANDAVRLGLAWLDSTGAQIASPLHILADVLDITVNSGRQEFNFAVSRYDAEDVDAVAPNEAVYVRPFVRVYGSGTTYVEVVEFADITDALDWAPEVDEFRRQIASMEFSVSNLLDQAGDAASAIEEARNASYVTHGTFDDARLSGNIMRRDAAQTVSGAKTFTGPLYFAEMMRAMVNGDSFALTPANGGGGWDTNREFGFDPDDGCWRFETALRVLAEIRAASIQATPIGTVTPAAGAFTAVSFTDAPTTRTSLDVYSKSETDARFENFDALVRKGAIDCSTNPNYPAANAGHVYVVSVAGKIGGASGPNVEAGDFLICNVDNSATGTQAAVGSNWTIGQVNVDFSAYGRQIAALADASAARALFGSVIGTDVQAYNATLATLAGLTLSNDAILQVKAGALTGRTPRQLLADLRKQGTINSDANFNLVPGTNPEIIRHTGTLTADRNINLGTGQSGDKFEITRTGAGAFNLSIGGLKNLTTNTWCHVVYDGTSWYLAAYGAL